MALFAVIHGVPSRERRRALLEACAARVAPDGRLVLTTWRRGERERTVDWNSYSSRARMPIDCSQLEPGDHLIPWGDGDDVVRYFHSFDESELATWTAGLPLVLDQRYRADGRTGDQNEYFVFRARLARGGACPAPPSSRARSMRACRCAAWWCPRARCRRSSRRCATARPQPAPRSCAAASGADARLAGDLEVAALVGPERDADLDTVMARGGAVWLIVGARYAGNVGTAIRTAEVSGADGVYIDNAFDHDQRREARRASMRADRFLPVAWERAGDVIGAARRAGKRIVGIEDSGTAAPWDVDLTPPLLFVAGGEAEGIPRALLARCDVVTRIPMAGFVASYNLQAAVAILAAERLRQRGGSR